MFTPRWALEIFLLVCWAVFLPLSVTPGVAADTDEPEKVVERELKHAETYYWFGMAEQGNMAAFASGLRHLDQAAQASQAGEFTADQRQAHAARIEGLRTDLVEQIEIAHDTLYGVFPLTRFLAQSIFADSISLKTFEVIDDPTVMASTFAAKNLAMVTIEQWRQRHQLDVVFTSTPRNPQLENESLYVFNSHPKFFVHNLREVTDALSPSQLAEFQQGRVTPEIKAALLSAFEINDLLVVTVKEVDVIDDDYFYILAGAIYHRSEATSTHQFAVMGFSRDRNAQFWPIIVTNLLLLCLTYLAFWIQSRARRKAAVRTTTSAFLLVPLVLFAIGRCSPWFFAPVLSRIAPIPETLAIVSFWVPALAGAVLTVLPMAMVWLIAYRLKKLSPSFRIEGRTVSVFFGIAAGAVGYVAVLLFLYLRNDALLILIPSAVGVFGIAFLLGTALDQAERPAVGLVLFPALFSLVLGVGLFQADTIWTFGASAMIVVACAVPFLLDARRRSVDDQTADAARDVSAPAAVSSTAVDGAALGEQAEHPRFQEFEIYHRCRRHLEPLLEGRTVHLALHGIGGCGLTSNAMSLVHEMVAALRDRNREAATMVGDCSHTVGEPTPYAPFQKALAQHFEVELLSAPQTSDEVDAALGEVFQSVVPFAGILFPASAGASTATSTEEIIASIAWMLRRLANKKTVVLFIDDVHWADDASRTLLRRLLREFPAGGSLPIAIIGTSHEAGVCGDLGFAEADQIDLGYPNAAEQTQILVDGIGLAKPTADQIVTRLGTSTVAEGGLFWLLQIVANLARGDAFVKAPDGFALRDGKWPSGMYIPNAMRDDLSEQLRQMPQYRLVIECAACACLGREFRASIVAEAIGKSRLELLAELDTIDRDTSILYDVRSQDDVFAFQSSFMLDVVREELRIAEHGPASDASPQIIREHHARLAKVCEGLQGTDAQQLYQVANHFYAAGAAHAERGMHYCLEAAGASAAVFDFDTAERFVDRAQECGQMIGQTATVEAARLRIACQKSHLTGQFEDHARVAEAGAKYLRERPGCSSQLLLGIAQAHYDAGKSSGDSTWFDRSLEIGRQMIEHAGSVHDEALGHHFVGLSLPPDQRDQRRAALRQALHLMSSAVDQAEVAAAEDLELLGRILGSLAEELSYGNEQEASEARSLFERRLQLYATHQVGDAPGLAKTHGGLGRLALFGTPQDIPSARQHFQQDLEISIAIGDVQGQTQMHSLLGACAWEEDDAETATEHYRHSWELAQNAVNRCFAGAGLLKCHARAARFDQFRDVAGQILAALGDGQVPSASTAVLTESLALCPEDDRDESVRELLRRTAAGT